ncbi:MAG: hypothetical protein ACFFDM_03830 [Candidatus Thorarchaeota archaeon]
MYESKIQQIIWDSLPTMPSWIMIPARRVPLMLQKTTPSLGPTHVSVTILPHRIWVGPITITFSNTRTSIVIQVFFYLEPFYFICDYNSEEIESIHMQSRMILFMI